VRWKSPAAVGTASQRVCAKSVELVRGRSIRIASVFIGDNEIFVVITEIRNLGLDFCLAKSKGDLVRLVL
jgi:hypothetical protein